MKREERKFSSSSKRLVYSLACVLVLGVSLFSTKDLIKNKNVNSDGTGYSNNGEDIINLNQIENGSAVADLKLAFDWEKTYTKELTLEEAFDYLGKDVRPSYFPEDLMEYDGDRGDRIVYNNEDDKILMDNMFFNYSSDFSYTNPPIRFFNIEVSKLGYQQDCIIYFAEEDMKKSIINGIEMSLGYGEGSYLDELNNEVNYTYYYAEFYNDGIYYKVNSENLTQEEFIEVLRSLV